MADELADICEALYHVVGYATEELGMGKREGKKKRMAWEHTLKWGVANALFPLFFVPWVCEHASCGDDGNGGGVFFVCSTVKSHQPMQHPMPLHGRHAKR
ncbi:hypothetical protein J3458_002981 [Metarhizium acridum]|uniref:uncharacterized protein n=1 Tax=Metarhizium acridum TaxID=92637 RepID=UPI001C6AF86B|nr:hypothetical protein J3458_002981 [Metarhizium acridum]